MDSPVVSVGRAIPPYTGAGASFPIAFSCPKATALTSKKNGEVTNEALAPNGGAPTQTIERDQLAAPAAGMRKSVVAGVMS